MKKITIILSVILVTVLMFSVCSCEEKEEKSTWKPYTISESEAVSGLKQAASQDIVDAFDFVKSCSVDWGKYYVNTIIDEGEEYWEVVLLGSASGYVQEDYVTRYVSDERFYVFAYVSKTVLQENKNNAIRFAVDCYSIDVIKY